MAADAAPNAAGSTDASAPPDDSSKAALAAREVVSSPALEKEFFGEGLALVPAKPGKLFLTLLLLVEFT
jgi:hypothetical protein